MKEAIILAGGFGTRLQSVVSDVPKPMAPVNGEPFLNYVFAYLNFFEIKHVVLSTGYLSEKISSYYNEYYNGIKISYTREVQPLGTGGGIRLAMEKCTNADVLVLNGDSFFDVDLNSYFNFYQNQAADFSLALRRVENAARYGTIGLGNDNRVIAFKEKDEVERPGIINGGVYILKRNLFLDKTQPESAFSIEKDFFEKRIIELNIFGYQYEDYFIDIGIPQDYKKVQNDFKGFKYR